MVVRNKSSILDGEDAVDSCLRVPERLRRANASRGILLQQHGQRMNVVVPRNIPSWKGAGLPLMVLEEPGQATTVMVVISSSTVI